MNTTTDTTPTDIPSTDTTPDDVLDWVEGQTHRLSGLVAGLTDEQLRDRPLPSGWSMLGLLGHVRDSTHFWLHHVVLGHPTELDEEEAWDDDPEGTAELVVASLVSVCTADVAAVREAGVRSDDAPGWWPEGAWGGYRQESVLGVLLHLLVDNAAHAGQLSIVRELTDGGVWDYGVGGVRVP